ncbi:hypothetical protein RUM43_008112 [Polyplax serrata]|uniref:Uncharacterized protein n=1 Tax=Polyplax serrata TaxID=468196 RepID=A0AAN8PNM0_POLSC
MRSMKITGNLGRRKALLGSEGTKARQHSMRQNGTWFLQKNSDRRLRRHTRPGSKVRKNKVVFGRKENNNSSKFPSCVCFWQLSDMFDINQVEEMIKKRRMEKKNQTKNQGEGTKGEFNEMKIQRRVERERNILLGGQSNTKKTAGCCLCLTNPSARLSLTQHQSQVHEKEFQKEMARLAAHGGNPK